MDLYAVLDQVVDLLRKRGQVSYRALTFQFQLDEAALEALKEELLYAHPVVDDAGRGLRWTGDAGVPPILTEPVPPGPAAAPSAQSAVAPAVSSTPDAERRQLTVMFCDLVGSTPLAEQLDPEDLRQVVRAYQQTCAAVIQRYGGHIAQLLGDALLVYFGWPQAHDNDAQRAVQAGLDILEAMDMLNTRLERDQGLRLAVRMGVDTGLAQILQGQAAYQMTGTQLLVPQYLALRAEVHASLGHPEAGLTLLDEALGVVDKIGLRKEASEIYRLKGELLLQLSSINEVTVETCFQQSLEVSRHQQAKSWELRATISLSRLWQQQGKYQEAHALLAPIYGWFTEGFDTADLQEAKALLENLG